MGILEEYLNEREEYFYPEAEEIEAEEPEDAMDEPLEDYGNDFVDDEKFYADHIAVKEIPDNSDPILDADEFMKPNAEILNMYSKGQGFDLTDNSDLYEVVKLVKDMTDKHLYMRNMKWKVDIAHRQAKFTFSLGDEMSKEADDFFLQGVQNYVMKEMVQKFGPVYKLDTKFSKDNKGRTMEMTIEKEDDEERMDMRKLPNQMPQNPIQRSSVSRI